MFTAFDFSIHNTALLSWSFIARELHARPAAQLDSAPETLMHPNEAAAG